MKQCYFYFGNGNPASYTGLSPTFIVFNMAGSTAAPPGITEFYASGATGIYGFQYGGTASVAFVIDGGPSLTTSSLRYITSSLDPIMTVDQSVGFNTDSFGTTMTDPTTVFGQVKRNQEFNEGDKVFNKSNGYWDVYNRGMTTLLFEKLLTNTQSTATSTES